MCEHSTDSGGNSKGDPPVPIPNTVVKPLRADGTWMDTSRESRSLPDTNVGSMSIDPIIIRARASRNVRNGLL